MGSLGQLGITPDVINSYDQRIPRYTSYPTAPSWTTTYTPGDWARHLAEASPHSHDLSLYVHIPFCGKRCRFCACNVIITQRKGIAAEYLDTLAREVDHVRSLWHGTGKVIQLHLGGGTPNYLTSDEMSRLLSILESAFPFAPDAERSIEVDPRVAKTGDVAQLSQLHRFNRISFGVQDFHPDTQAAVGREQTRECTFSHVEEARSAEFSGVNIDLIYGLPRQTRDSWTETLNAVTALRPDRIALYNFAYLPGRLAHQRDFENEPMPSPSEKLEMFAMAHDQLVSSGWRFIGMDHYALESDALSRAQQSGSLRRNFMGYTTLRGTDMLSFGTSAISDFQGVFAQNVKKLNQYHDMINEGLLPIERGLKLSEDDLLRRQIIEEVMCNGILHLTGTGYAEKAATIIRSSRTHLSALENDGLLELTGQHLRVLPRGWLFLRNIAAIFDAYLPAQSLQPVFSRSV